MPTGRFKLSDLDQPSAPASAPRGRFSLDDLDPPSGMMAGDETAGPTRADAPGRAVSAAGVDAPQPPRTLAQTPAAPPTMGSLLGKATGIERELTAWERAKQAPLRAVRAVPAGWLQQVGGGSWGLIRRVADAAGLSSVAEFAAGAQQTAGALGAQMAGSRAGAGTTEQAVYSGMESIGGNAPAMAIGVATGGASVPLAIMGAQSYGSSYGEARDKGLAPEQAGLYAAINALVEVATEKTPAATLFKDLQANAPLRKVLTNQLIEEVQGEEAATLLQDANDWAFLPENRDKTLAQFAAERPGRAVDTLIATLTATMGMTLGAAALDRAATPRTSADVVREGVGGPAAQEVAADILAKATGEPATPASVRPAEEDATSGTMRDLVAPPAEAPSPEPQAPPAPQSRAEVVEALLRENPATTAEDVQAAVGVSFPAANDLLRGARARLADQSAVDAPDASVDAGATSDRIEKPEVSSPEDASTMGDVSDNGIAPEQAEQLTALGYDPAAMTMVDAQEVLRGGEAAAAPPVAAGAPITDAHSYEALSAAAREVGNNPNLRRRRQEMADASKARDAEKQARPRGGGPPVAEAQDDAAIEARTVERVAADPDAYVDRYLKDFGTVLNADNASELFPEYAESSDTRATRVKAVRKAASAVVERAFDRLLAAPVPEGKQKLAVFTSGGNGSGKSSTTDLNGPQAFTWDTTASQVPPTVDKIDRALAAGFEVVINHASVDPVQALTRAISRAAGASEGRTVTIPGVMSTHAGARQTLLALAERYADNPHVDINVFDNNGPEVRRRDLDWLQAQAYPTGDDLRARLHDVLDGARDEGAISDAIYRGFGGRAGAAGRESGIPGRTGVGDARASRADGRADAEAPVTTDAETAPGGRTTDEGPREGAGEEGPAAGGRHPRGPARVRTRHGRPTDPGVSPEQHRARLIDALVADAKAAVPDVDEADLRDEIAYRIAYYDDVQQDARQHAPNPRKLLEAIAKYGGLAENDYRGYRGELARLKEGLSFGRLAGVPGVFRKRTVGDRGEPVTGVPLDVMLPRLHQDPEFRHIETIDMLVDALDDIRVHGLPNVTDHLPNANDFAGAFGEQWWTERWRPQVEAEASADDEVSFDPDALEAESQAAAEASAAAPTPAPEPEPAPTPAPAPVAAAPAAPEDASPIARHDAVIRRLYDGAITADELRAAFQALTADREAVTTALNALTKDALLKRLGGMSQARYRNEKKNAVVRQAWQEMLGDFIVEQALSYNPMEPDGYLGAVRQAVQRTTDADIAAYAARVAAARQKHRARVEGYKKAITNPETLAEFETLVRAHKQGEAGLTDEQRRRFDELRAEKARGDRQAARAAAPTVEASSTTVGAEIVETVHTRDKYPLFVVKLAARVERDDYKRLLDAAKKLGGWYSAFRGNGAVPGFQFKARESAEAFKKLAEAGDTAAVQETVVERRAEKADAAKQTAAERLDALADTMEAQGEGELGKTRQANTARRARMASAADETARATVAVARTLRNLAAAMRDGQAKHLEGIRFRTQVQALDEALRAAQHDWARANDMRFTDEQMETIRRNMSEDVLKLAKLSPLRTPGDAMRRLGEKLADRAGYKRLAARLQKQQGEWFKPTPEDAAEIVAAAKAIGEDSWQLRESLERRNRFASMGITDDATLRTALREYVQFKDGGPTRDRVKELERDLAGNKGVGVDFFPTPKPLAERMARALDIAPGMRVLEPSAGKGNLADAVRAVQPDAAIEVVEQSSTLRDLLEAKHYTLVGRDFMDFDGGPYDRIIMNPPFSNGWDADHVRHAYDLLAPGGKMAAITGEGIFFRGDAKATAFREWFESVGGESEKLEGAFLDRSEANTTGVNSRLLTIEKPAAPAAVPQALSAESLAEAFGLTPDQAAGTMALVEAMGLPLDQIRVVKGGRATDDALEQGLFDDDADVNEFGEAQPRLPGEAGAVRDEERAQPKLSDIEDEFRLTPQYEKRKGVQRTLFQRGDARVVLDTRGWYYDNVLEGLRSWQAKGTPEQVLAHLKKFKGALEEAKDLGLDTWLAGQKSVTREQVQQWVRDHEIKIQERTLYEDGFTPGLQAAADRRRAAKDPAMAVAMARGNFDYDYPEQFLSVLAASDGDYIDNLSDGASARTQPLSDADVQALREYREASREVADLEGEPSTDKARYKQYQTGGPKQDYREILLTLPARRFWLNGEPVTDEEEADPFTRQSADRVASYGDRVYNAPHFEGIPNILLHLRVNVRTLADGRRVLFAEELQSDLHQQGRRKGYGTLAELPEGYTVIDHGRRFSVHDPHGYPVSQNYPTRAEAIADALDQISRDHHRVPDAPFKGEGWKRLGLKRLLALAAEEGLDGVAWTTGEQQADRYDLSKQISRIEHEREVDDNDNLVDQWNIRAFDKAGQLVAEHEEITADELEGVVGKELAQKIVNGAGEAMTDRPYRRWRVLSGLDLKVGGEGMRGFYDRELVNLANDLAKRHGQKVERGTMAVDLGARVLTYTGPSRTLDEVRAIAKSDTSDALRSDAEDIARLMSEDGHTFDAAMNIVNAAQLARHIGGKYDYQTQHQRTDTVHVLATPAEMREAIRAQKLPLYQRQPQGAHASVEFLDDGKALIRALTNPNVTSPIHEIAHVARRWLLNRDIPAAQRRGITDEDIATTEAWAGATDGHWDQAAEETFARGFERYVREGGPTLPSQIREVFRKMAAWFSEVYQSISGSEIDVEITPAMRAVFDRLVTRMERVRADDAAKAQATAAQAAPKVDGPPTKATAKKPAGPPIKVTPVTDTLDTGEAQTRLPGEVGAVRDEERAQPTEDVPAQTLRLTSQQVEPAQAGLGLDPIRSVEQAAKARLKDRGNVNTLFQRAASDQTETPAFQQWFGESKVTDENGDPLRVYHGTTTPKTFDKFKTPAYFTDSADSAAIFGEEAALQDVAVEDDDREVVRGSRLVPAYLSIQNPKILNSWGDFIEWDARKRTAAERAGFDGVTITMPDGERLFMAFRPEQIKSAIGNRGTFDPTNPSILYQSPAPTLLAEDREDLAVIAAAKVARGFTTREAFDREMRREFGDGLPLDDLFREGQQRAKALDDLDVEDYFNFRRIDVSDAEKAHLRGALTETVLRTGRLPKERESWDTIRQEASELAPEIVDQLVPFQQMQAPMRAARLIARQRINALNLEIAAGRLALEGLPGDAPETFQREQTLAQKERDLQGLLDVWMRLRSEDGRNLAMHRMMVGSLESWYDAAFWLSKARQELGLPVGTQLPVDVFRAIQDILNRGRHAVETGQPVQPIQLELSRYLTRLRKSTLLEIISAVRKAGLLTGPKTFMRNVAGNAAFATLEELSRIPAVVIDFAVGTLTGHRTVHGVSTRAIAQSSKAAAESGLKSAATVLRAGGLSRAADAADRGSEKARVGRSYQDIEGKDTTRDHRGLNSGIGWLDGPTNAVFRVMGSTDRIFKSYAFRRSLEEQAALEAINRGVSPIELLANPSAEMLARAVADAEFATFNNPNTVAEFVTKGKAALKRLPGQGGKTTAFVIDMAVPFVNTPSNILARMLDYTPGGAAIAVGRAAVQATVHKGLTPEQQRLFALGIARGATGSALIYLGWMLAAAGLATGMGDDDEGDRNVRDAAGMLAGAVKVGDRWHQIASFSPAGNLVTLGATIYRTATKPLKDELLRGAKLAAIAGRLAIEQPMLKGLNDLIQSLQRPEAKAEAALGAFAGSFVPTLVNDVASAFDPYRRDTRPDGGFRESLWTGVAARLPGLRNQLPTRLTVLGDTQDQDPRAIWDPTIAVVARDLRDDVLRELVARDVGITWPRQTKDETAEQYRQRIIDTGHAIRRRLDRLIDAPNYRQQTPEKQAEMLTDAITEARRTVRPKKQGPPTRPRFQ